MASANKHMMESNTNHLWRKATVTWTQITSPSNGQYTHKNNETPKKIRYMIKNQEKQ